MAQSWLDGCRFNATSTGTGSFVYASPVQGYATPAIASAATGATYRYRAENADMSEWEIGTGVLTIAAGVYTLTRATVSLSSTGAKVAFSTVPQVAITFFAADIAVAPQIIFGTGTPISGLGKNGDVFIDNVSWDVYDKVSGAWTLSGNIKGGTGAGIPTGGATAAVLTKINGSDYNTQWSPAAGFFAWKNGTAQVAPTGSTYVKVTYGTEIYDTGSYYDTTNSRWTPPAGPVFAQMNALWTGASSANYECYIVKNGDTTNGLIGFNRNLLASGQVFNTCAVLDKANGTDYYEAFIWHSGTGDIFGAATITAFFGAAIH